MVYFSPYEGFRKKRWMEYNRKIHRTRKKMTKIRILYCWSCMSSTVITSYTAIMIIDLWSLETWCQVKSTGPWDYYGIGRNTSVWIPTLAHARCSICHSPSPRSWQQAGKFCLQDLLEYFYKTGCGLGRRQPLLSDSSPVSVFPGEINLKILFANWPSSSNCQLLQMQYPTETYKITMWFSSTQTAVLYFSMQYFTQGFPST